MKSFFRVLLFVLGTGAAFSCREPVGERDNDSIVAYYNRQISRLATVNFVLQDSVAPFKAGLDAGDIRDHISLHPKLPYEVTIHSNRSFSIQLLKPLPIDGELITSIHFAPLLQKSIEAKADFRSTVQKIYSETHFDMVVNDRASKSYAFTARINTNDFVEDEAIESRISVSPGENFTWEHSRDGKEHVFSVPDITRKDEEYSFTYEQKNGPVTEALNKTYIIAREGQFQIIGNQLQNEATQRITILFSALLDAKQKLRDLIRFTPSADFTCSIKENRLNLYPNTNLVGKYTLEFGARIADTEGRTLGVPTSLDIFFPDQKPTIELMGKGNILAPGNNKSVLIRANNYAKAQVRVKQIYENNLVYFFQNGNMDSYYSLYNLSKVVADTVIPLNAAERNRFHTYSLNLSALMQVQPGALYRIEVKGLDPTGETDEEDYPYWFGDYRTYETRSRNVMATDIGLLAKGNDRNEYLLYATRLSTAEPYPNVKISLYDRMNQITAVGTTDSQGALRLKAAEEAVLAVASAGNEKSYLQINNSNSLSTSNFDVDGALVRQGTQVFIFGERGVWRPGDTLHIAAMLKFKDKDVPKDYPVTAVLTNPRAQEVQHITAVNRGDGLYYFPFVTEKNAPTGRYEVCLKAGGQQFCKTLAVETVKPNRLTAHLAFDKEGLLNADSLSGNLHVAWLHGRPGANLKAVIELKLSRGSTSFEQYPDYTFEDVSRSFHTTDFVRDSLRTDAQGDVPFNFDIRPGRTIPGILNALFTVRTYEPSGDFSRQSFKKAVSPFTSYMGLKIDRTTNRWGEKYLDIDQVHDFHVIALDERGKTADTKKAVVEIYRFEGSWWWHSDSEGIASYIADSGNSPVEKFDLPLERGEASFTCDWHDKKAGMYFIRVSDPLGGHAASQTVLVCGSDFTAIDLAEQAVELSMSLDKTSYKTGETAMLNIASAQGSRALVSIENSGQVLNSYWADCRQGSTTLSIPVTRDMYPNAYVFVTLIQPHDQTCNDAPMRLYGIRRIEVSDPGTLLEPRIGAPAEIRPETALKIEVSEAKGRAMSYVLAVVDEGLLSLTRFKTPDPHGYFYAREALGVRTWDLYDRVTGAYGAKIEQLFAIGGGDAVETDIDAPRAERFRPVTAYLGPFHLQARGKASHTIDIPPYFGSLRVMLVATDGKAQGCDQRNIAVKSPLMVKADLPRSLAVGESLSVPVSLYALEKGTGKVEVSVTCNGTLNPVEGKSLEVDIPEAGEKVVYFPVKAGDRVGKGEIRVSAKSRTERAAYSTAIDVQNPNTPRTVNESFLLEAGREKFVDFTLGGLPGSNTAEVSCSTLPPVNLQNRLRELLRYPYDCLEQITSVAIAQLFLPALTEPDSASAADYQRNIANTLNRLSRYKRSDNLFSYWPGGMGEVSDWAGVYAGYFMILAEAGGYALPKGLKENWRSGVLSLIDAAQPQTVESRAFALYALALDGKSQHGAMNRMRDELAGEKIKNYDKRAVESARWLLAAAYAADHKPEVARSLIAAEQDTEPLPGSPAYFRTFYSPMRAKAVRLLVYQALKEEAACLRIVREIAKDLNKSRYYLSAQSTAWALTAIGSYAKDKIGDEIKVVIEGEKQKLTLEGDKAFVQQALALNPHDTSIALNFKNESESSVYCVLSSRGIPAAGRETAYAKGLELHVDYFDRENRPIDVRSIEQGSDFYARVTLRNKSGTAIHYLSVTQRFPSGWEIRNPRLDDVESEAEEPVPEIGFRDYRDDRVYTCCTLDDNASLSFKIFLTATYPGRFYLPAATCSAMYDASLAASTEGGWIEVKQTP